MPDYGVAGPARRYVLIVAMLTGLSSAPALAVVTAAAATVRQDGRTPGLTPLLGPRPPDAVTVPGGVSVRLPTMSAERARSPRRVLPAPSRSPGSVTSGRDGSGTRRPDPG